jgi:hypothetical protein
VGLAAPPERSSIAAAVPCLAAGAWLPPALNVSERVTVIRPMTTSLSHGLSLDLGSGPEPAPGFVGVDLMARRGSPDGSGQVIYADLFGGAPWPFDDQSCGRLRSWHVIEHIPRDRIVCGSTDVRRTIRSPGKPKRVIRENVPVTQDAFFWFFDQAFRIAAPGCRFELAWPHPQSDGADQDPTHARRIPSSAMHYLSIEGRRAMRVLHYPAACDWRVEPGSLLELGSAERLAPFTNDAGEVDVLRAKQCHGVFNEIRVVLVKPEE